MAKPKKSNRRTREGSSSSAPTKSAEPATRWRVVGAISAAIAMLAAATCVLFYAHYNAWSGAPVLKENQSITLIIPHDTAWPGVLELMHEQGLITRPRYFDFWARRRELPRHVKAGNYSLTGPLSLEQLDETLRQGGATEDVLLTIPEGFNIFHIADRVEALGLCGRAAFLDAVRDKELLREHDIPGESFEGYLFPDTYRIAKGSTPRQIVETLHAQWEKNWQEIVDAHPDALKEMEDTHALTMHDIVILASIVERETNYEPELGLVARVFLNRLEKDMRLQTDPTCVYGEETYDKIPAPKYCKNKLNRYSTYMIDGLPPGPISNPGKAALQASLIPTKGKDAERYLFFVARRDGTGAHHFTKTFKEHKQAIKKYLK